MKPVKAPSLRPEVLIFARDMENALRKNDDKPGWRGVSLHWLARRLIEELEEVFVESAGKKDDVMEHLMKQVRDRVRFPGAAHFTSQRTERLRAELVDVANFCMMIHDRLAPKE